MAHLFDQNRRLISTEHGIMEFPSREDFGSGLFHWDEAFISPCTLNEIGCGRIAGSWTPKQCLIGNISVEG